tara:strand:- start:520 stop:1389 length:870 start_codon:yes stop_codon:yes gene_type:complete
MTTERPRLKPLNSKPLMVHVVLNVEYWPFEQAMPRAVIPPPHGAEIIPDVANYSWVEYGMRVGVPRILRMLSERNIRASAFMNAYCLDIYPSCADAMLAADWEFVGHCWVQRSLANAENEIEVIDKTLARLENFTGRKTRGWLGAGLGETFDTPDYLCERGIEWVADWYVDDLPCWMRTKHGPMLAMPYTVEHNDVPMWVVQSQSSDEFLKRAEAALDVISPELADNPQVFTLALHPHVVGVAHRAHYLGRVLDMLMARDDTVFVTGSEIADWFIAADGSNGKVVMADD